MFNADELQPIGFVGLGRMGAPMAARLASAGRRLVVYDSSPTAGERLTSLENVTRVDDINEVSLACRTLILMLPDSAAVTAVLEEVGLLDGLRPGSTIIDMGSSDPFETRRLAALAGNRDVTMLDAPVSGGVTGAESGTLTIMVGGPKHAIAGVRQLLEILGDSVVECGESGAGHAVKALNNSLSAVHLLATSEALTTAAAFGLDQQVVLDVVNSSSGRSGSTEQKWPRFVLTESFDSGFALQLMTKDIELARGLSERMTVPARLTAVAAELWRCAATEMDSQADHTEIARWVSTHAGSSEQRAGADVNASTANADQIREQFRRERGVWNDTWELILGYDPEFVRAYLKWSTVPDRRGALEPAVREYIFIAVDAVATHMYSPGTRAHIRKALEIGASEREILEVIELVSTVGIHACNIGLPILRRVLVETGHLADVPAPLSDRRVALKSEFSTNRGYWHEFWDPMLELDPDLFESYTDFSSIPWRTGVLPPKVKEFIYIAFDAAATHLYVPGLELHIRNALALGATADELIEVLDIASVIGVHAALEAVPILADEARRFRSSGASE